MSAAPVATERLDLQFGEIAIGLLRVADLEPHIDAERLTGGGGEVAEPPYWMHLWPGAMAAARWLATAPALRGARVLELGCGMGLPALVAARRGAAVVATDWKHPPLRMLATSARVNDTRLAVMQMDWRASALRHQQFDLVVGADVGYDARETTSLVTAIADCLRSGGRFLLADSVNTYRRGLVEEMERCGFTVRETEVPEVEDGRRVWVRCLEGVTA